MTQRELRMHAGTVDLRAEDGAPPVLTGYGATFNRRSQNLGGFVEEIDTGAFDSTLRNAGKRDVIGAVNHDLNWLLATTDSGSLVIGTNERGLHYAMTLDPSDPDAIRAIAKVRTGKFKGSSFSFATRDDSWGTDETGFPLRTLLEVELYELGPVASPAYLSTKEDGANVALRSLATFVDLPFEQVNEAARMGELTNLIRRDLPPEVAADEPEPGAADEVPAPEPVRAGPRYPRSR